MLKGPLLTLKGLQGVAAQGGTQNPLCRLVRMPETPAKISIIGVLSPRNEDELWGAGVNGAGWAAGCAGVAELEVSVLAGVVAAASSDFLAGFAASSAKAADIMKNARTATANNSLLKRLVSSLSPT